MVDTNPLRMATWLGGYVGTEKNSCEVPHPTMCFAQKWINGDLLGQLLDETHEYHIHVLNVALNDMTVSR